MVKSLKERGIHLHEQTDVIRITAEEGQKRVHFKDGESLLVDVFMGATGRKPKTDNLGLETLGVKMTDAGAVIVDEFSQSSVPSIYAVGDVTNRVNLTPVAIAEGHAFADSLYGDRVRSISHETIASAVFSCRQLPQLA